MKQFLLFVAQGFGSGRMPFAPGTFGSLAGIGWLLLLLIPGSRLVFLLGAVAGAALSVFVCGFAEKALGRKDPGSVVLDEIVAMPFAFAGWIGLYAAKYSALPAPGLFFQQETWLLTVVTFGLFRLFDIAKPWPVSSSQSLPGGWGVTVDDLLAALYAAAVSGAVAMKFFPAAVSLPAGAS